MRDVTAVLMCAGLGSRSRAAEEMHVPKCLLKIDDRPFLDSLLHWLMGSGIENVVLVAHTHGEKVLQHLASTTAAQDHVAHVQLAMLPELRDTNWTALHGLRNVRSARALILTADTVWRIDLPHLLEMDDEMDVWIPVVPASGVSGRLPNIFVDEKERVRSFQQRSGGKQRGRLGVGLYLVNSVPALLAGLSRPGELDSTGIDPARLKVSAYTHAGDFVDFGTDENLAKLRSDVTSWPEFFAQ